MPIIAKDTGGNFELIPAGTHQARCYLIADIGSQMKNFAEGPKLVHEVVIVWELAELMTDGRPFAISNNYTLALSSNSHLRKALQSWRGKPFSEVELQSFDLINVLNSQCLINVIHRAGKNNGKTFANVDSIMPLPKGMPKLEPVNETVYFALDEYCQDTFAKLPNWIQGKVKESPEGQAAIAAIENQGPPPIYCDEAPGWTDDIPF